VLHQIGNGALGPVFRAYDSDRDRLVAIKVFRLDLPPERVHQLVAEFEQLIAAELQHPVIAAPRAAGIDAGNNAFLAQDFAAADSLDIVVRENGRAQLANTLRVASQLAEALDYAADRQVLHGALHPRDILLSEDDIRIVGVGVSRALERVGVTTPVRRPYSAPERINDEGWDQRADVFSLAAIVYELLCGKRVAGTGSEAAESLTDVAGCDVAALQRVFALALAADPGYRFATATAFTDALKEAAADTADKADSADVSAPKQKARRPRTTLKVVTPPDDVEELVLSDFEEPPPDEIPELTLTDVEAAAPVEEPSLPLIAFADDLQEQLAAEPPPKIRLPRRRKVPAPTPVAIETVASADLLQPAEPAAEPAPIEHLDLLAVPETPLFEAPALEPLAAFASSPAYEEPLVFEQQPAFEELPVAHEFMPEPVPVPEPSPEPWVVSEPVPEPRLPAFLEPPPRLAPAPAHSSVGPLGRSGQRRACGRTKAIGRAAGGQTRAASGSNRSR
jgi:serine/threonine protein kinase